METERPTVVVAALTYQRPEMLGQLLRAFLSLEHPDGWAVRFLVVDNDPEASAGAVVKALGVPQLSYVVETEPGIPFARNRAIDEAVGANARLLCFIDDDEIPDPNWLREIVGHFDLTRAVLIAGPVRTLYPSYRMNAWQRFLARSLIARTHLRMSRLTAQARMGNPSADATSNWLGDLHWIQSASIRFDENLRFTGGSDTRFFLDVRDRGGAVSWCDTAIVSEHLPLDRLSMRYQFRRARSQAIVSMSRKQASPLWLLSTQPIRIMGGVALMLFPVQGIASFGLAIEIVGRAAGKLSYLWGSKARLYERR